MIRLPESASWVGAIRRQQRHPRSRQARRTRGCLPRLQGVRCHPRTATI